jgi:hypothetical protein
MEDFRQPPKVSEYKGGPLYTVLWNEGIRLSRVLRTLHGGSKGCSSHWMTMVDTQLLFSPTNNCAWGEGGGPQPLTISHSLLSSCSQDPPSPSPASQSSAAPGRQ